MPTDSSTIPIFEIALDKQAHTFVFQASWWIVLLLIAIGLLILGIYLYLIRNIPFEMVEMEVELSTSPKATFKVKRDASNLYIANRIHIELTTRKVAIEIDPDHDIIVEVYDSWYEVFGIIRNEIKNISGEQLFKSASSGELIDLTRKILNEAMRPHLTEHQARFRTWYEKETKKDENNSKTPQEIQKTYPKFDVLLADMQRVNTLLKNYAGDLQRLIHGSPKKGEIAKVEGQT